MRRTELSLTNSSVTATIFEVLPTLSSRDDILSDNILREAADRAYYASQIGPWTVLPCSVAYCPLAQVASPTEQTQLHIDARKVAQETRRLQDELLGEQFDSTKELRGQLEYIFDLGNWSTHFQSEPGKKYGTLLQMLQYPFSRGSIHIPPQKDSSQKSTIHDKPIINPRYYLGPGNIDRQVMALGQRMAKRIAQTEPLAKIIQRQVFPPLPDQSSTEQSVYEDFVTNYTVTDWHRMYSLPPIRLRNGLNFDLAVGTCAMGGSEGAKAGVVDERLRVYGVRGLRVIDASIMPLQVGAHIQATVYAIAEKGAAMIREDWS
jgi:choline dehydrogenase-like flavoprotein